MKKLLLILLCLPLLFGCGSEESNKKKVLDSSLTSLKQGCNYGSNTNDASELCEFFKGNCSPNKNRTWI